MIKHTSCTSESSKYELGRIRQYTIEDPEERIPRRNKYTLVHTISLTVSDGFWTWEALKILSFILNFIRVITDYLKVTKNSTTALLTNE